MIETSGSHMSSAHYARLGEQERKKIHMASLEILERVGVDVHHEKARDILVSGGARADGLRVRISEYMVARALATAPKRLVLHDRHGRVDIRAWGYNSYYGGGSDCLNLLDHRSG
ncbi:MAG: trimethylamine methyltransferase, partial [Anaerolineae bacterium]|nr:trimethylamine methyltransferase [Anaerolineae bacterium]